MSLVKKMKLSNFVFFRHEHRIDTTKSWNLDLCLDIGPWNQDPSHGTWDFGWKQMMKLKDTTNLGLKPEHG